MAQDSTAQDSTAPGYLAPVTPPPPDDAALDLLIQPALAGITGLPGSLVRRKGQEKPPPQPDRATTWCAFAVTGTEADANPTLVHDGAADGGQGLTYALRQETHEVTASFYGPAAKDAATALRDGLGIAQNRDALRAAGLAYVAMDRLTFVPDLQNTEFVRRVDLVFRLRRMAVRTYAVRNIASATGSILADTGDLAGPATVTSPFDTTES